eukprot:3579158-Pleurochrysis_carterae.AAC.3
MPEGDGDEAQKQATLPEKTIEQKLRDGAGSFATKMTKLLFKNNEETECIQFCCGKPLGWQVRQ